MTLLCEMASYDSNAVRVDVGVHVAGILGGSQLNFVSPVTIYITALVAMFGISAVYNLWPRSKIKWLLWRMDHCSIIVFSVVALTLFWTTKPSLSLLTLGFVIYLAGIPFLLWTRLRFHNAIWHGFVLMAAFVHYEALHDQIQAALR